MYLCEPHKSSEEYLVNLKIISSCWFALRVQRPTGEWNVYVAKRRHLSDDDDTYVWSSMKMMTFWNDFKYLDKEFLPFLCFLQKVWALFRRIIDYFQHISHKIVCCLWIHSFYYWIQPFIDINSIIYLYKNVPFFSLVQQIIDFISVNEM